MDEGEPRASEGGLMRWDWIGRRVLGRVVMLTILAMFAVAFWFRVEGLPDLPGINGDEAWYGVQAENLLAGRPVAWRTPTGLPLNPFLVGIEVLLLTVFEPSFWILRAPSVICGVLAVVLTYVLGSRVLDRTSAWIATILMAALPITIGYSRFGWDPSQTPLFSLLAVMFALRGRMLGMVLAFLACLMVHATNIFLLPVLILPFAAARRRRGGDQPARARARGRKAVYLASAVVAALVMAFGWPEARNKIPGDLSSLADASAIATFLMHYGRLISGISLYTYIVGPVSPALARVHDWVFWGTFLVLLDFGLRRLVRQGEWERVALVVGLGASVVGLYVVGGPDVIQPHSERYGMFLVVPTVLSLACLARSLMPVPGGVWPSAIDRGVVLGASVVGGMLLAVFHEQYFEPLRKTGSQSHRTFQTSTVEPKGRAFEGIVALSQRFGAEPGARVLAEDWWLYQPLRFLAGSRSGVEVVGSKIDTFEPSSEALQSLRDELWRGTYLVGFVGGPFEKEVLAEAPDGQIRRWIIPDRTGKGLIGVYRLHDEALARQAELRVRR